MNQAEKDAADDLIDRLNKILGTRPEGLTNKEADARRQAELESITAQSRKLEQERRDARKKKKPRTLLTEPSNGNGNGD